MGRAYDPNYCYYVVTCRECGEVIPLAMAPSPEEEPEARSQARQTPCPRCHVEGSYSPDMIGRRRGHTAGYRMQAF